MTITWISWQTNCQFYIIDTKIRSEVSNEVKFQNLSSNSFVEQNVTFATEWIVNNKKNTWVWWIWFWVVSLKSLKCCDLKKNGWMCGTVRRHWNKAWIWKRDKCSYFCIANVNIMLLTLTFFACIFNVCVFHMFKWIVQTIDQVVHSLYYILWWLRLKINWKKERLDVWLISFFE